MDAHFISGLFLSDCLPRDKQYLYRYFKTRIQRAYVRYVSVFGNHKFFVEHTGIPASNRSLQLLAVRLHIIEEAHRTAKSNLDLDALEQIEKGNFNLDGRNQSNAE